MDNSKCKSTHGVSIIKKHSEVYNFSHLCINESKNFAEREESVNQKDHNKLNVKIGEVDLKCRGEGNSSSIEHERGDGPIIKLNTLIRDCKKLFLTENAFRNITEEQSKVLQDVREFTGGIGGIKTEQEPVNHTLEHKSLLHTTTIPRCIPVQNTACSYVVTYDDKHLTEVKYLNLHEAVRQCSVSAVKALLTQGADPDEPDWSGNGDPPILHAALRRSIPIIKALCDAGCDVNACSVRGESALHVAVSSRPINKALVQTLLDVGCNPNIQDKLKGHTALHRIANVFDDEPDLFLQLASVTDINLRDHRQNTVLHRIADITTNCLRLQQVLDLGANPSLQNDRGETALCVALEHDWTEGAVALIHNGTDLHCTTLYRETALHISARKNKPVVVAALFDHGAPVNTYDLAGNTPLHLAAGRGFKEVVQLMLISPQINLNAQNKEGSTPLHTAVESGFIDVVEMLIQAEQIDLKAKTALALTALDLAEQGYRRLSQPEMFQVLTRELERRQAPHLT